MCGIVGYLGSRDPKQVIISGLRSLEYRGYDSAGVAILDHGKFKRIRAEGKIAQLEKKLETLEFDGHIGIGHTRWATHGPPSERNAHPHSVAGVSIVHNGIIENYNEIRRELMSQGCQLESDTDSELVAHLLAQALIKGGDLLSSVLEVMKGLRGAYSILAVSENQPDEIVAFKNGPPLVAGKGMEEVIIASDVQAIIPYSKEVVYLRDHEVLRVKNGSMALFDSEGRPLPMKTVKIEWSEEQAQKRGYPHFMLKEIFEQPQAVAQAIAPHIRLQEKSVCLSRLGFGGESPEELSQLDLQRDWQLTSTLLKEVERIFIVACGTSYYAGMVGEYLLERLAGLPTEVDLASEFRYRHPVLPKNSLLISISQSGETADTLAAVRLAKDMGARILSISNVRSSSIDREAHGHLYMNAGLEVGVASTKAFVATLALLNVLSLAFAQERKMLPSNESELGIRHYLDALIAVPSQMENVLAHSQFFADAANTLKQHKGFLYLGRGVNYPLALEGALKLKELAYMHAEGYAAGEMKHGPLALIDQKMAVVMLAPQDELQEKAISNLEEAKARGGVMITIGTGEDKKLQERSEHYISIPAALWSVNPLLLAIPLQLLAYHVASSMGHDVDQPRNLAKSVTVE